MASNSQGEALSKEARAQEINDIHRRTRLTLEMIRIVGEHFRAIQKEFPHRAPKGEGFFAWVNANCDGIKERQVRNYMTAAQRILASDTGISEGMTLSRIVQAGRPKKPANPRICPHCRKEIQNAKALHD